MKDNLYNPCPNIPAPDCGCEKPPVCPERPCPPPPPPQHHCHERPCPPPPPPCGPTFPPFCPEDKPNMGKPGFPGCGPMPPVPSVVTGMDLYEAMNRLNDRVNLCIHNYNAVMAEGYKTLHNMQRAAQENGAYYGPCEVWVEEGYYADESSTYHLVHKACVDRRGEPIRMQLHLAYGNTTNSKIEQKMFNASKVEFADKIVVAIPKGEGGWYGKAIWHGCPIQSDDKPELYTVGFTKSGVMRVYNNGVDVDQMLRDTVVDAMGCSGVLIQNGQVTDESYRQHIPNAAQQTSRVCIGQNLATREVIILTVGNENDVNRKGLTSMACAQILRQYGCDIAVELCEGVGSGAMDKGSLMYVPDDGNEPTAYAYWFISRKCFYKSDYERELAELVQNYGACIWQGFLNKKAIAQVKQELADEIARATEAERVLQENINKETERATAEEQRIEGKVDAETERATEAERVLQENIDRETQRATGEEQRIEGRLNEEIQRATGEEQRIEGKLDAEIQRATGEEQRIDSKLDAEIQRAKDAEKVLTDNLDAEIHRAQDEEAKLHGEIETERGERKAEDLAIRGALNDVNTDLTGKINAESQARIAADTALDTKLSARIDTWEKEVTKLQGLMTTLQNQMTSLDTTVTTVLNTVSDIEVALNNVKTSIADIISGKTILPYVRLAGDTMTGVLNMGGNNITGLPGLQFVNGTHFDEANGKLQAVNGNEGVRVSGADAVDVNDFVTKKQLDNVKSIKIFKYDVTTIPNDIKIPCVTTAVYQEIKDAINQGIPIRLVNSLENAETVIDYAGKYVVSSGPMTGVKYGYAFVATLQAGQESRSAMKICLVTSDKYISQELVPLFILGNAHIYDASNRIDVSSGFNIISIIKGETDNQNTAHFSWSNTSPFYPEEVVGQEMIASLLMLAGKDWVRVQIGEEDSLNPILCFDTFAQGRYASAYYISEGVVKAISIPRVNFKTQ